MSSSSNKPVITKETIIAEIDGTLNNLTPIISVEEDIRTIIDRSPELLAAISRFDIRTLNTIIEDDRVDILDYLVTTNHPAIHTRDAEGNNILMLAAANYSLNGQCLPYLLSKNIYPLEATNNAGETAYYIASSNEAAAMLQQKGANVYHHDNEGLTRFDSLLLGERVDISSPYEYAAHMCTHDGDNNTDYDINHQNNDGDTTLIKAANANNAKAVKFLLNTDNALIDLMYEGRFPPEVNVNLQNKLGETALMAAVRQGSWKICKILLEKGAKIDLQNNLGETAMMIAAHRADFKIYQNLTGDPILKNKAGQTALDILETEHPLELKLWRERLIKEATSIHNTQRSRPEPTAHPPAAQRRRTGDERSK